jgi:hypothetical protein
VVLIGSRRLIDPEESGIGRAISNPSADDHHNAEHTSMDILNTRGTPHNHSDGQADLPRGVSATTQFQRRFGLYYGKTT